ncbi:MAG: helix-turn-helix transcriptional regulator [Rudaea sp.]|nr:helix-turn-helix transcriptional regulator [Rudaea sp.]
MAAKPRRPAKDSLAPPDGEDGRIVTPFDTDRVQESYEHSSLFECQGATVAAARYESTPAAQLRSKNSSDVVFVMLQGTAHRHEGEIDGRGFRYGAMRVGQASAFPLATSLDISVGHTRVESCEFYFPQRFAKNELGIRGEGALRLQMAKPDPFLFHAAKRFVGLGYLHDDVSEMQKESLFRTLALHLFAAYGEGPATLDPCAREFTALRAYRLRSYIDGELHRRISCRELAVVAGCDLRELSDMFRTTFKATPAQYVIDRRLDRASQLIRDTTLDLADIAFSTGFSGQSHLTTALRKRRGVTPYQLRTRSTSVFVPGMDRCGSRSATTIGSRILASAEFGEGMRADEN